MIVVDNGSDGPLPWVTLANPRNTGFAHACNAGAQLASGDVLVFLNNDTETQYGWLRPLVAPIEEGDADITGARLVYPNGTLQHAGVEIGDRDGIVTAWNRLEEHPSGPVQAVTGACLAVKRRTFQILDGFDTGYVNGYEDVDFCLRATHHGFVCWYAADSTVMHHESASPGRFDHARENVERLHERWSGRWQMPLTI